MRLPKKEEIPYIIPIVVTSLGIIYNFFPISISNILILLGIDFLLSIAWKRFLTLLKIESLLKKEKFFIDRGALRRLSERLEKAKNSIWIMAESFGSLIGVYSDLLIKKYHEGCEIKILLVNPKIIKSKMMSNLNKNDLRTQIQTSINFIKKFKDKSDKEGIINGRLLPFEPGFGLFIIDGDSLEGEIKVELMLKNTSPDYWPNVIITREDYERYAQLIKHFNKIWDISDPI